MNEKKKKKKKKKIEERKEKGAIILFTFQQNLSAIPIFSAYIRDKRV